MRTPKGVPADEWRMADMIAKVSGLFQYELVDIDDDGAEIRYLPEDVGRALTSFDVRSKAAADFDALCDGEFDPSRSDPNWQDRVDATVDNAASLDSVDQTEPVAPDEAQLVDMPDRHSDDEVTHVGTVDSRFDPDNGGTL